MFAKKQTNSFSGISLSYIRIFCLVNRIFAPHPGLFGAFSAFSPFFSRSSYLKPLWTFPRFSSSVSHLSAFILLTAQQFCRIMASAEIQKYRSSVYKERNCALGYQSI